MDKEKGEEEDEEDEEALRVFFPETLLICVARNVSQIKPRAESREERI